MIRKEWLNITNKKIVSIMDDMNRNLLFYASNIDEAEYLLSKGVDINHRDNLGRTPLWKNELTTSNCELINFLFYSGINADIRDFEDDHVLLSSISLQYPEAFLNNKQKYKTREIFLKKITFNDIKNIVNSIKKFEENGFKVSFPFYIHLDVDVTKWDKLNSSYLSIEENIQLQSLHFSARSSYMDLMIYLLSKDINSTLISTNPSNSLIYLYEISDYLNLLDKMHFVRPTLNIIK